MENNRAKILQAAARLITQKGIPNTSISDIARETGLSKGTLYYYYKSKDDLIYDLVDQHFQKIIEALIENFQAGNTLRDPVGMFRTALEMVLGDDELGRNTFYLTHEAVRGNQEVREKFVQKYNEWRETIAGIVTRFVNPDLPPGDLKTLSSLILAIIDGLTIQALLEKSAVNPAAVADMFGRFLSSLAREKHEKCR
ncbi:MAG: TetR/AcrR family transcriptional regulator [Bacillota bacterium]